MTDIPPGRGAGPQEPALPRSEQKTNRGALKILIALLVLAVVAAIVYHGYVQPDATQGKLL